VFDAHFPPKLNVQENNQVGEMVPRPPFQPPHHSPAESLKMVPRGVRKPSGRNKADRSGVVGPWEKAPAHRQQKFEALDAEARKGTGTSAAFSVPQLELSGRPIATGSPASKSTSTAHAVRETRKSSPPSTVPAPSYHVFLLSVKVSSCHSYRLRAHRRHDHTHNPPTPHHNSHHQHSPMKNISVDHYKQKPAQFAFRGTE
jgi:hypothetical protein